ncbi:MAG: A/G-specific adenine glycosylase, partial [Anaerolineae bacterium]
MLLTWYAAHRRDLPWRRTDDPYLIWVSEVMLQQTQVVTVIPYYERFTARFPTICDLAAADLDEVLSLWQGLGYYARAHNLHAAARIVCAEYGGRVPDDAIAFRALPGIGEYMVAAVLSIAYGHDLAAIDGNVVR